MNNTEKNILIEYGNEDLKQILENYFKEKFIEILKKEESQER